MSNLTVTPCVLLYCDCFMIFEAFPSFSSCCCCLLSKQKQLPPSSEVQLTNVNQQAHTSEPLAVINDASKVEVADIGEVPVTSMDQQTRKITYLSQTEKSQSGEGKEGNADESMLLTKDETDEEKRTRLELLLADSSLDTELRMAVQMELEALPPSAIKMVSGGIPITQKRQFWFHIAFKITQWPLLTLAACTVVTVPFVLQFLNMHATSDNNEVYLRGSTSVKSLKLLSSQFPIGSVDPYQIVCTTNSTVLSKQYFMAENALIHQVPRMRQQLPSR